MKNNAMKLIAIILSVTFCIGIVSTNYSYQTGYIPVPVDQFSLTDNRTFQLRYLFNNSFWVEDGPIFFYAGNEAEIEMFVENTGYLWEVAIQFKAFILFIEHRYFGRSLPFGYDSFKAPQNFDYLTTAQAMADFVDVINHVKCDLLKLTPGKNLVPVIAFGGSYGGSLAAWMRMKYPAVVHGALASSAPMWGFPGIQLECDGYNRVLTAAFNRTSHECVKNIRKSWDILERIQNSGDDRQWLNWNWKVCTPLQTSDDVISLTYWLSGIYSTLAMSNYPYEAGLMVKLPANPVQVFCSHLNTPLDEKTLLAGLFQAVQATFNYDNQDKCLDWAKSPYGSVGEGWNIQSCSELVLPSCANGITDMFPPEEWNFTEYAESCFEWYGVKPLQYTILKQYGGRDMDTASNIIFSNGLLDPWSSAGVLEPITPSTHVIVMKNAAHHLDLRAFNHSDPPDVIDARNTYASIFQRWIREYRQKYRVPPSPYDEYLLSLGNDIIRKNSYSS